MRRANFKFVFVFLAILGLLIFLYFTNLVSPIKEKVQQVFNPVMAGFYSLGSNIKNTYKTQTDKKDVASEIERLEKKVNTLIVENAKLKNF